MKKILITTFLVCSLALMYKSYINFTSNLDTSHNTIEFKYDTTGTEINLDKFNKNFFKKGITAIGVIGSETCSSCVTELFEFSDQINLIEEQFFDFEKIEKYYAVIGKDSLSAKRFRIANGISEGAIFVDFDTDLGKKLYEWEKDKYLSQWIFIDNESSMITSRIPVLNRLTPLAYKSNVVEMAVFAK